MPTVDQGPQDAAASGVELLVESHDDLAERIELLSQCTPTDAALILSMLDDPPVPTPNQAAAHAAGLARFAARFRVVTDEASCD